MNTIDDVVECKSNCPPTTRLVAPTDREVVNALLEYLEHAYRPQYVQSLYVHIQEFIPDNKSIGLYTFGQYYKFIQALARMKVVHLYETAQGEVVIMTDAARTRFAEAQAKMSKESPQTPPG